MRKIKIEFRKFESRNYSDLNQKFLIIPKSDPKIPSIHICKDRIALMEADFGLGYGSCCFFKNNKLKLLKNITKIYVNNYYEKDSTIKKILCLKENYEKNKML